MTHQIDLTLLNRAEEVARFQDKLEQFAARHSLSGTPLHQVQLALEEHLTNILHYAYDDQAEHQVTVSVQFEGTRLKVEITDDGRPFNPLEYPPPDLSLPIDERRIGGLGIHMLRKSMDHVEYHRTGDRNVLTLVKRI